MNVKKQAGRSPSSIYGGAPTLDASLARHYAHLLERYELLFKATHDVVYDLDLHTGIVQWNEALYSHYGYKQSTLIDTIEWWTQHIHPDDALRLEAAFSEALHGDGYNWEYEYRFRRADGVYVAVRDRGLVMRSEAGDAIRMIGSFLDVTKQQQLNRAKDEFISLASHQLKTPLTVIRTYSEMLTQGMLGPLADAQYQHIERITAATVRLIRLVNGILNVSRFEMNDLPPIKARISLTGCLEDAIAEVQDHAQEKHIKIRFKPPVKALVVYTDRIMFDQIMNNLLVNAINYSPADDGRVTVSVVRRKAYYEIRVKDNGIGIPSQDQAQLFNRFYRASNAINASERGSGLGLYFVKLLATALGGKVWFQSTLQTGTTFFLQLPTA